MAGRLGPDGAHWVRTAVERFQGPLTLYASRLLGDADTARDVVQDTFLKLCAQEEAQVGPHLAEWLFTVCRNRAMDVLRKEKRMAKLTQAAPLDRPAVDPPPGEALERRETLSQIVGWVDLLPPNQREVIRLRFQNGFSYKEISKISGQSVANVGYLLHAGMKSLRGRLAEAQI
jgi:RNA polymerase sigma-70 factor (ECF subfamily)